MDKVLILKVVKEDMTSHNGFKWPDSGEVVPEVWDPAPNCGNGLHGWLAGEGSYRHEFMEGTWIVFAADKADVVSLDGGEKVKVRRGEVIFKGSRAGAVEFLIMRSSLSEKSDPGWCCFSLTQLRELAYRAATRAVKKHAPKVLRARNRAGLAKQLEAVDDIVDRETALKAKDAANAAYAASAAAAAAAYAAAAADSAADAYAAYAAAAAADYAADAAAAYAAAAATAYAAAAADYAADAAAYAADSAAYAADSADSADSTAYARQQEREEQRLDKLELLGFNVRSKP